jgi:hypothetical protein
LLPFLVDLPAVTGRRRRIRRRKNRRRREAAAVLPADCTGGVTIFAPMACMDDIMRVLKYIMFV